MLTTGVDVADGSSSSHDGVADTFKFTNAAETVEATAKTLTNGDTLNDGTAGDGDVLRLNLELAAGTNTIGAKNIGSGFSATNIEKLVINGSNANRTVFDNTINMLGLTDVQFSGDFLVDVKFDGSKKVIETLKTIDASDVTAGTVTVDASKANQALTITGPKELAATITGGKGDDTISAQGSINGGNGNDSITLTGAGTVKGGKGDDTISADVAEGTAISIDGEVGNDIITVSGGGTGANVVVKGGDGDDVIDAGNLDLETTVNIDGSGGADVITVSGSGTVAAGAGDDIITVMAGKLTVNAESGNDVIDSSNTAENDVVSITAGAGDDVIKLGDATEIVAFDSSASTNGQDIITGFTAGVGGDVLAIGSGNSVNGLLGSAFGGVSNFVAASAGTGKGDLTNGGNSNEQVLIHASGGAIDAANASTNFSTKDDTNYYKISSSQKLFVVDTVNNANILYLVDGSGSMSITRVGTLNVGTDIKSLTADNFGDVA